ncbi:MAG TPA: S8 family serine peptidase [Streptosporangiaceae bacterium]|jgi:subtilase family serine protease|nr:S8 family serine peptidase [Streptosporangiaceae bacterium]
MIFAAVAAPAGAATGLHRTAAQLAGAGARPAGCAAPARPGIAHCYLATEPAPAAAVHVLETGCTVKEQDGYSPCNIQHAYKLPSLSGKRGKGQTVAVIDAYNDPNAQSDLATYRSAWGLPVCSAGNGCFKKVNQNGDEGNYPPGNMGWGLEISGDLDMVSAICPRCHILLVEATSNTFTDLFAAEQEAVRLGAHVASLSWGSGEFSGEKAYDSKLDRAHVEVTASSGDGAYQGGVQYPSASPYVTSAGGTELTPAASKRGWIEKTWVTAGSNPPVQGSGSGCSAYESKPKWQKDHGCTKRTTADVSAVAANVLGYDSYQSGGGGWYFFFGTSLSAPIAAAVYGLAGNAAAQTVAGAVLPYSRRTHFYDITRGLATGTCSHRYLCKAVRGYDGPTGLGTPFGAGGF